MGGVTSTPVINRPEVAIIAVNKVEEKVVVIDGVIGEIIFQTAPFEAAFTGGVYVAAGDINGDGFADLVVSAGFGGGPRTSIYDGAALAQGIRLNVIGDFFLFEEALRRREQSAEASAAFPPSALPPLR